MYRRRLHELYGLDSMPAIGCEACEVLCSCAGDCRGGGRGREAELIELRLRFCRRTNSLAQF